ncbi:MAG: hypothetical protein EXS64_07130 [Candidatus Latescibacteria bacterium]|nr:hypothetical protein [Candidatus Latescibacterota bacterium]
MNQGEIVLASVPSVQGHTIRLTYRQWVHITESHDYMVGNREKVLESVLEPDQIVTGDLGAVIALRHFAATNITKKTCVVIYRDEPNGFIVTAFLTSRPDKIAKRKKTLWIRPPLT